ncbi:transposase [Patescibacteria group bacterium]|nr:transposase [Patescibacteria group bacterium]
MILTFKIRHNRDFTYELMLARKVAEHGIKYKIRSSKDVKHIGLKSAIANQILKKYSYDKKAKKVNNVKLTIPNQSIKVDKELRRIKIPCLKFELNYQFRNDFKKINQIEIDNEFAYISVTIPELPIIETDRFIGIDRNTTGHSIVVSNPETGKVWKLGKELQHIHKKYMYMRKNLQKNGKYKKLKEVKDRESRIVRDINHKMSSKVVDIAIQNNCGIKMEDLKNIRNTTKQAKSFKYSMNCWSFYQQQQMIEYKAKLHGIPIIYVEPSYTSQICSRCGWIGNRNDKAFKCLNCGHVDHADVNASFNISVSSQSIGQSYADRDVCEGSTDTPKEATIGTI